MILITHFFHCAIKGNRKPFNYGIGAISGFVIYRYKLTAEEIAQLCGIDFQSDVFPDTGNDRTWKSLCG